MKYIIKKKIEIPLEIEIFCRKCDKAMIYTANITENHLYFACAKCGIVIVINLKLKGE